MTILLRPVGRGGWTPVLLRVAPGRNAPGPLSVALGDRWTLAGQVYRVIEVRP